jgi:phytoene/squalene synthetase
LGRCGVASDASGVLSDRSGKLVRFLLMPPSEPPPPDRPDLREQHPAGEEWRADALARSRHSRLDEEVRAPEEAFDEEKALELCGEICRNVLGDFSPALLLLSSLERQRVQTLLAFAHTLFDFARQHGVEGEKLSQINRWEFTLDLALGGQPVGQPIFVRMAREQRRRAWPTAALDELMACARRRATRARPATPAEAEANAERLARALATALIGEAPPAEVNAFLGALVRIRTLQTLGAEIDRRRYPLAESELPDDWSGLRDGRPETGRLVAAVQQECARLRPRLLRAPRGLVELPAGYRRAAIFCLLAALRLLTGIEDSEADLLTEPPQLGLLSRLAMLTRARWFG